MDQSTDLKYADVTQQVFDAVGHMEKGTVKVISQFDMLEGARALEMGNAKLDTGLLELSDEELAFDASRGQSLLAVVATMNKLLILYMTWLEGLSLMVTIFSCRYMLDFLENYRKCTLIKKASFINLRLHPAEHELAKDTNSQLVNVVLRGFVIGLSKLIGFSLNVATNVLYEEEDLVTRSMKFDFFSQVSPQIASAEIEEAELWLQQQSDLKKEKGFMIAVNQLKLIKALVRLENVLTIDVELFKEHTPWGLPNKASTLKIINLLKDVPFSNIPSAAVSRFAQVDCDNKHLPSKNAEIGQREAYDGLANLVISMDEMLHNFTSIKNLSQLQMYLKYDIGFELATSANALTRGIFKLFFIRDDRSIAGLNENIRSITTKFLELTSLCGNSIIDPKHWTIQNSKNIVSTKADSLNRMSELLTDLEAASLHKLGAYGNNRCRQRQINNKLIALWDSLHFNAKNIEAELFQYGIGDRLSPALRDQAAFGICSYVYLEKLDTMIDVALSGFEQDLYKLHEAPMMYWYVSQLCNEAYQLIIETLVKINNGKLQSMQNLPKKIKGTKAGPKKEALRAEYAHMKDHLAPVLTDNVTYLEKCHALMQLSLRYATKGISMVIVLMRAMCETGETSTNLVVDEQLYKLRMKPWSSVGVPEVPSYEEYLRNHLQLKSFSNLLKAKKHKSMLEHILTARFHLNQATSCCGKLQHNLEYEQALRERTRIGETCTMASWFGNLHKTCDQYKSQLELMQFDAGGAYAVKRVDAYLQYFPLYSIVKRA